MGARGYGSGQGGQKNGQRDLAGAKAPLPLTEARTHARERSEQGGNHARTGYLVEAAEHTYHNGAPPTCTSDHYGIDTVAVFDGTLGTPDESTLSTM
jgi:hypothetical protein